MRLDNENVKYCIKTCSFIFQLCDTKVTVLLEHHNATTLYLFLIVENICIRYFSMLYFGL